MFKDGKDPSQQKDPTHNRKKKPLGIVNECMPWQKDITSVLAYQRFTSKNTGKCKHSCTEASSYSDYGLKAIIVTQTKRLKKKKRLKKDKKRWPKAKPSNKQSTIHLAKAGPVPCCPRAVIDWADNPGSSLAQSCPTLFDPMDCSTPGFPVHHQLPELAQSQDY